MEEELLSRSLRIGDRRTAAALSDPLLRRLVLSLAHETLSVGEIAERSGIPLKRVHHHVTRLYRLGLLQVADERRRPGRPIKLYRAAAPSFFIPFEIAPELLTEPLSRELRERLRAESLKSIQGMLLATDESGVPLMRYVSDEDADVRASEFWLVLRLLPAEAERLRLDLKELLDRHARETSGKGKPYLLHAALAQRVTETLSADNRRRRAT